MALREILVEFGIEVDKAGQKRAEESVGRITKGLGGLKTAAIAAGAAFLTGKLAQGLGNMVVAAGDAAEIANKFGAVFVEQAGQVGAAVDDMADRTGQSRIALQEMAADAGALVKPLVGSTEAAGELAKTMTEAALDISSFENVLPQDALGAIRSAIIGSSEPMLRFGVDTRQAALAQFALEKGLTKSIKSMSTTEVTALRMELIMKRLGTKGAVGDATKTAGSFTNRLRAMQGAFSDLQAEIGKEFLPAATDALRLLIDFAKTAGPGLAKAVRGTLAVLRSMGRVLSGLGRALFSTHGVLLIVSAAVLALGIGFAKVGVLATLAAVKSAAAWLIATLPLLLFIALMIALGVAIFLVIDDLIALGDGSDSVIGEMITGITDLTEKWGDVGTAIGEMLDTALRFWLEFFGFTREATDQLVEDLFLTLSTFWENVIESWKNLFFDFIDTLAGGFASAGSFVLDLLGADEAAKTLAGLNKPLIGSALSGAAITLKQGGGTFGARSPAIPSGGGGTTQNNTTNLEIKVDAGSVSDPAAVADMVSKRVASVVENQNRQTAQALAVGGK